MSVAKAAFSRPALKIETWAQHAIQLSLEAPTVPRCCSRLKTTLNTPGAPGAVKVYRDLSGLFRNIRSLPPAFLTRFAFLHSQKDFITVHFPVCSKLLVRLQEEHSTLLSQHFSTVFLVMGTGWALVLRDDGGLWSEHPVGGCEACPEWVMPAVRWAPPSMPWLCL